MRPIQARRDNAESSGAPPAVQPRVNAPSTGDCTDPPMTAPPPATYTRSPMATLPTAWRGVGLGAWLRHVSVAGSALSIWPRTMAPRSIPTGHLPAPSAP